MSPAARRTREASPPTPATSGLLAVDKPAGATSHDLVEEVRRRLDAPGAGHLGTLDPAATGLLLVAVGAATRCVPLWQGGEKTYEATIRFGVTTSTQDLDGEVLERRAWTGGEDEIRRASEGFVGEIEQVPPMVSALKVGGQRLHRLARRGVTVEREPRRVRIAEWTWLEFAGPEARFRVRCSSGTYVRTLAHDLGARLGCGAALAALRRLASAPFDLSRSVTSLELRELDPGQIWDKAGIPLDRALAHFPRRILAPAEIERVGHGNPVARTAADGAEGPMVLVDGAGTPLGIAAWRDADAETGWLQPSLVFPWAVREGKS